MPDLQDTPGWKYVPPTSCADEVWQSEKERQQRVKTARRGDVARKGGRHPLSLTCYFLRLRGTSTGYIGTTAAGDARFKVRVQQLMACAHVDLFQVVKDIDVRENVLLAFFGPEIPGHKGWIKWTPAVDRFINYFREHRTLPPRPEWEACFRQPA